MRSAALLVLVVLLLPPSSAAGAVYLATSVEETARTSDAVVRGNVARRTPRLSVDGRRILTEVEIEVGSAWKGQPGRRVTVVVPGGVLGGEGQWVDAAPSFADGEEVVVFLSERGPAWRVNGLAIGKYRVVGEEAIPDLGNVQLVPAPLRAGEALVAPMSLAELEHRVRSAG